MANTCMQFMGFVMSFIGWIGLIIATATNDWVVTCKYNMSTCKKMDELEVKGLWADCVISTALYHCKTLTQILDLPDYIQTSRALMVTASILGLPALALVLMSMSCINLGSEPESAKNKRSVLGGILIVLTAFCGIISTVWFPIGAHHERSLMSFGFSLYSGWVGTALCLLGGCMITCCSVDTPESYTDNDRFYFSKQGPTHPGTASTSSTNHAKSAHV
ncbi:claudin-11-like [Xyrauchen texanus]|uniref:claudin-11-like n=1 Tax=Xyrauchen texanus TaxID=154827 RepID=UPI002242A0A4|nr:claudin-11-like [Xyrauchen texanus]